MHGKIANTRMVNFNLSGGISGHEKLIAFLRGINISSKKQILIEELRKNLKNIGFRKTKIYFSSGNVFF